MHHLDRIQRESMSESHKIQIFIRGIEDDDYVDVALHLQNSEILSLDKAISAIQKREQDLKETKAKHRTPFHTPRMEQESASQVWMKQDQQKYAQNQGRPLRRLETVRLTQGGYIKPPKGTWYTEDMPEEHKMFVQDWNAKVAHGEDTSQVNVPMGITILSPRNKWAQKARRLAEQAKQTPVTPSPQEKITGKRTREETPQYGSKRINFNLDPAQQENEE